MTFSFSLGRVINFLTRHHIPLTLTLLSIVFMTAGATVTDLLRYDRPGLAQGQLWRVLSANLVHLGWPHLLMNLAGLLLIWALFHARLSNRAWWLVTLTSALGVSLGLWLFNPDVVWYVGLSGTLHGLFAAGLTAALLRTPLWDDWLLLVIFSAKLLWEIIYGPMPGSEATAGGPVIVVAHLYGAIAGALSAAVLKLRKFRSAG